MNKPLALTCCGIACVGLLVLGHCVYLTIAYGHGNPSAGNFHRCIYSSTRDPVTGKIRRDWDTDWDKVGTTEEPAWADMVDMWLVGVGLVILGATVYLGDHSSRGAEHF